IVLAASGTLYVDENAVNCSNAGTGTTSQPYCSIGAAASAATAGMTVYVNTGTYYETVNAAHSGVQDGPITFQPNPGSSVTISGQLRAVRADASSPSSSARSTHTVSSGASMPAARDAVAIVAGMGQLCLVTAPRHVHVERKIAGAEGDALDPGAASKDCVDLAQAARRPDNRDQG